jgi:hypothetical protein
MTHKERDNISVQTQALMAYLRATDGHDDESRTTGILELRNMALESRFARHELRRLIYAGDGATRILAAEALSRTASFPRDAIPVLIAVLDVCRKDDLAERGKDWARVALGALANYEKASVRAEKSVWPYIHAQRDPNLQLYAIKVVSVMAPVSEASWTILCILCRHEDAAIRDFCRELMSSDSFKEYVTKDSKRQAK